MKIEDFLNENNYKDLKEWHDNFMKQVYYSQRGYFLQKYMEVDDFKSEVYVMLIKYWNFDNFRGTLKTYLGRVTEHTMLYLYRSMDTDKNIINHDDTIERLDKEVEEGEQEIDVAYFDNYFNEKGCIDYVTQCATNDVDRQILTLYLNGVDKQSIANTLKLTRDIVRYRIEKKYKIDMQKRFNEYVNNI